MENEGQLNSENIQIQRLLNSFLPLRTANNGLPSDGQHLDEDSLTAFVEGNLAQRETQPIVNHLVECSFCRHVTAELVRLDLAFADEELPSVVNGSQPSKISEVLSGLLARIFGNNDGAVFAHQEKEEELEEPQNSEDNKK